MQLYTALCTTNGAFYAQFVPWRPAKFIGVITVADDGRNTCTLHRAVAFAMYDSTLNRCNRNSSTQQSTMPFIVGRSVTGRCPYRSQLRRYRDIRANWWFTKLLPVGFGRHAAGLTVERISAAPKVSHYALRNLMRAGSTSSFLHNAARPIEHQRCNRLCQVYCNTKQALEIHRI